MKHFWHDQFWKDTIERAAKTFAQVIVVGLAADATAMFTIEFIEVLKFAAAASVLSFFSSILSSGVGSKDSASLVNMKKTD